MRRQRPGGSLAKAHAACRAVRAAGLPLEITFAPTRINIHEAEAVIERARALGAFRFNTGQLMRIGTAARLWERARARRRAEYARSAPCSTAQARGRRPRWNSATSPFELEEALRRSLDEPPATLLVLPNGWVKVAAALPHVCADLRRDDARRGVGGLPRRVARAMQWSRPCAVRSPMNRGTRRRIAGMLSPVSVGPNMERHERTKSNRRPRRQPRRSPRRADAPGDKQPWETPKMEDVSEEVMAQPYIRFT